MSADLNVRYTKTADGVSIAFARVGEGAPLIWSLPMQHLIYSWESPMWRPWFEALTARYELVIFDARSNGLSQRGLPTTPEGVALDLQAVVDQLALDNFFVFGQGSSYGHGSIRYAVAHPERVAGLILWGSYVSGDIVDRSFFIDVPRHDWEFFLQSLAQSYNWLDSRDVRDYVQLLTNAMTQSDYLAFAEASLASDVRPLLSRLHTPTLVLHPRQFRLVKPEEAMRLASMIPDARLVLLDGAQGLPVGELAAPALAAITAFIDGIVAPPKESAANTGRGAETPHASGTAVILFTDIVDSTALTERLGDARFRDASRALDSSLRTAIRDAGGAAIDGKLLGDGVLATFPSAAQAIDGARRCLALPPPTSDLELASRSASASTPAT